MKILHVIPYFYPAWRFGGPVRVAYDVSRKLVERGHSVVVYSSDIEDRNTRVEDAFRRVDGVDVFYFKNLSLSAAKRNMILTPSLISAVRDNIRSFDVVHIHGNRSTQSLVLHYFLKKNAIPYVVQAHGGLPSVSMRRLKRFYDVLFGYELLGDASKVIALSQTEAQQYRDMGVPVEKIAVIPNGIDLSEYGNLPPKGGFKEKFGIREEEKIVLYVGRVHESKGLDLLAHTFGILSDTFSNVRLAVVGPDDGYAKPFSTLLSRLGLEENVLFTGFVDKRTKLAAFVDSNVFVTPHFSGFPVTFLEACLACCPIVTASDELNWINNNIGYVTEYSSNALARGVTSVLQDKQVDRNFRNNCRHIIRNFDISTVVSRLEDTYESILP